MLAHVKSLVLAATLAVLTTTTPAAADPFDISNELCENGQAGDRLDCLLTAQDFTTFRFVELMKMGGHTDLSVEKLRKLNGWSAADVNEETVIPAMTKIRYFGDI